MGFTDITKLNIFKIENGDGLTDFTFLSSFLQFGQSAAIKNGGQKCFIE